MARGRSSGKKLTFLASAWRRHPSELRADLQEVYGIDWDRVLSGEVSLTQAAACAACLRPGSRVLEADDAEMGWSRTEMLMLSLRNLWASEPLDPFAGASVSWEGAPQTMDALKEIMGRKREVI